MTMREARVKNRFTCRWRKACMLQLLLYLLNPITAANKHHRRELRGTTASASVHRETIVDRDALKEYEKRGINASHPEFYLNPPGHQAKAEEYPFFAYWENAGCSATVIHDDIMLSAAHCLRKRSDPHRIKQVRLLTNRRKEGGITRSITHWERHPDLHSSSSQSHDFVLIKLNTSVLVDDKGEATGAQVVTLNKDSNNPSPGDNLTAVGFGAVVPVQPARPSKLLMDVQLEALPNELCAAHYGGHRFKDHIMLCVGTLDGSRDTCHGDSGGPLLDVNQTQVGIVSFGGKECAHPDKAGVAARIDATVVEWIQDQICRLSAMPPLVKCQPLDTTSYNYRLVDHYKHPITDDKSQEKKGLFDLKITVQHDKSSWENSWSLTHLDSFDLLYWQPYNHIDTPNAKISHVFANLKAGRYSFAISDSGKDGMSFEDGPGGITIINEFTGDVLWQHFGEFGEYVSVILELDSTGTPVSLEQSNEWDNPVELNREE